MNFENVSELNKPQKKRIEILDALRGSAVVFMVYYHLVYDMVHFLDAPANLFTNDTMSFLQKFFACVFVLLCGVSSNFSRSNIKRGLETLGIAVGITVVTTLLDMPIVFGVLHLLSFCMLFYGVFHKLLMKTPKTVLLIVGVAGAVVSKYCIDNIAIDSEHLWIFGWASDGFVSYDYFPLFPWFFVFLAGVWAGYYIKETRLPVWFYKAKVPVLSFVGRHSLGIYIVHQPVLMGITMLLRSLK